METFFPDPSTLSRKENLEEAFKKVRATWEYLTETEFPESFVEEWAAVVRQQHPDLYTVSLDPSRYDKNATAIDKKRSERELQREKNKVAPQKLNISFSTIGYKWDKSSDPLVLLHNSARQEALDLHMIFSVLYQKKSRVTEEDFNFLSLWILDFGVYMSLILKFEKNYIFPWAESKLKSQKAKSNFTKFKLGNSILVDDMTALRKDFNKLKIDAFPKGIKAIFPRAELFARKISSHVKNIETFWKSEELHLLPKDNKDIENAFFKECIESSIGGNALVMLLRMFKLQDDLKKWLSIHGSNDLIAGFPKIKVSFEEAHQACVNHFLEQSIIPEESLSRALSFGRSLTKKSEEGSKIVYSTIGYRWEKASDPIVLLHNAMRQSLLDLMVICDALKRKGFNMYQTDSEHFLEWFHDFYIFFAFILDMEINHVIPWARNYVRDGEFVDPIDTRSISIFESGNMIITNLLIELKASVDGIDVTDFASEIQFFFLEAEDFLAKVSFHMRSFEKFCVKQNWHELQKSNKLERQFCVSSLRTPLEQNALFMLLRWFKDNDQKALWISHHGNVQYYSLEDLEESFLFTHYPHLYYFLSKDRDDLESVAFTEAMPRNTSSMNRASSVKNVSNKVEPVVPVTKGDSPQAFTTPQFLRNSSRNFLLNSSDKVGVTGSFADVVKSFNNLDSNHSRIVYSTIGYKWDRATDLLVLVFDSMRYEFIDFLLILSALSKKGATVDIDEYVHLVGWFFDFDAYMELAFALLSDLFFSWAKANLKKHSEQLRIQSYEQEWLLIIGKFQNIASQFAGMTLSSLPTKLENFQSTVVEAIDETGISMHRIEKLCEELGWDKKQSSTSSDNLNMVPGICMRSKLGQSSLVILLRSLVTDENRKRWLIATDATLNPITDFSDLQKFYFNTRYRHVYYFVNRELHITGKPYYHNADVTTSSSSSPTKTSKFSAKIQSAKRIYPLKVINAVYKQRPNFNEKIILPALIDYKWDKETDPVALLFESIRLELSELLLICTDIQHRLTDLFPLDYKNLMDWFLDFKDYIELAFQIESAHLNPFIREKLMADISNEDANKFFDYDRDLTKLQFHLEKIDELMLGVNYQKFRTHILDVLFETTSFVMKCLYHFKTVEGLCLKKNWHLQNKSTSLEYKYGKACENSKLGSLSLVILLRSLKENQNRMKWLQAHCPNVTKEKFKEAEQGLLDTHYCYISYFMDSDRNKAMANAISNERQDIKESDSPSRLLGNLSSTVLGEEGLIRGFSRGFSRKQSKSMVRDGSRSNVNFSPSTSQTKLRSKSKGSLVEDESPSLGIRNLSQKLKKGSVK